MKRFLKRVLFAGGIAAVGYQGFRAFRVFKVIRKLEQELPEYLETTYGEKPQCNVSLTVNIALQVHVKVVFSPEFLLEHQDLEDPIRQYILDTYPILKKCAFRLFVVDSSMSKVDILKKYNPRAYKIFGKIIEQKLKEKEAAEVPEEPAD